MLCVEDEAGVVCLLQLMLGVPEQALSVLQDGIEPVLAHGAVIDKGRALLLMARCQMAAAGFKHGQGPAGGAARLTALLAVSRSKAGVNVCSERPDHIYTFRGAGSSWLDDHFE